jgi:hypothetical protein
MMTAFRYTECPYPIRATMADGYRTSWEYIGQPGNWWTGEQRIAIVQACRDAHRCPLCTDRKSALSPYAITGDHARTERVLSDKETDAIHRITTDAARLTKSWIDETIDDEFTYGHYVEAVSVIVTALSIDSFHRALDLEVEPLPDPVAGQPSRYWPPGAAIDVAWVPMLLPENLTEAEADIFLGQPQTAHVLRAMSLIPDAVRHLVFQSGVQYVGVENAGDPASSGSLSLSRAQVELVAARTSVINDCFY